MFWKAKSEKDRLEEIFFLISKRDQNSYKQAIVELNERIKRIIDETQKLNEAVENIVAFGIDYDLMTEKQQYALGAYVNLMNASTQLLVNSILGLQPKYTMKDLELFFNCNVKYIVNFYSEKKKNLIVYVANLMYKIDTTESDRKLLSKSFRSNKEFIKNMKIEKSDLNLELFNFVDEILGQC